MALVWALFILEAELGQQYFEIVDYDMQHKPQQIKNNGFWELEEQFFELKQLDKNATLIPKPYIADNEPVFPSLNINQKDLDLNAKYQYDVEELLEMGYEFL
jgi:hypothetical protein